MLNAMDYDVEQAHQLIDAAENSNIDPIYRAAASGDSGYNAVLAVLNYFGVEYDLQDPDFDPVDLISEFV